MNFVPRRSRPSIHREQQPFKQHRGPGDRPTTTTRARARRRRCDWGRLWQVTVQAAPHVAAPLLGHSQMSEACPDIVHWSLRSPEAASKVAFRRAHRYHSDFGVRQPGSMPPPARRRGHPLRSSLAMKNSQGPRQVISPRRHTAGAPRHQRAPVLRRDPRGVAPATRSFAWALTLAASTAIFSAPARSPQLPSAMADSNWNPIPVISCRVPAEAARLGRGSRTPLGRRPGPSSSAPGEAPRRAARDAGAPGAPPSLAEASCTAR